MMTNLVHAYTKPGASYPGYVNVKRADDGSVVLTARGDPASRMGAFVCGYPRDKGQPGRCTPGDEACNNYCNLAPEKGPMAAGPLPTTQTFEGATATIVLTEHEWHAIVFAIEQEMRLRETALGRVVPPHGSGA